MSAVSFLFIDFGPVTNNHFMGSFSILSILKFLPPNSQIILYTDKPELYSFFSDKIVFRELNDKILKDWRGPHDFMWRIKIKALMDSAAKDSGHLIYLDMDTFAQKELNSLVAQLDQGTYFMHLRESLLSQDKAKNKQLMWSQVKNKTFAGLLVDQNSAMWNAGLVALPENQKKQILEKTLKCNDEMCEQNVERWLIEQFSLSLALANTQKLKEGAEWFIHYWYGKDPMMVEINKFLATQFVSKANINHAIEKLKPEDWVHIGKAKAKQKSWKKFFRLK